MNDFTNDELNLLCIYNTGSRQGLIAALNEMRTYLETDERELMKLTDSALEKLSRMCDKDFEALELVPDFDV